MAARCRRTSRFGRCDREPDHSGQHAVHVGGESWFGWARHKIFPYYRVVAESDHNRQEPL